MVEPKLDRKKSAEQFPLLHVVGEVATGGMEPGYKIATPRRSWVHRWPEYVSACWMLMILLTIGVLGVYVLAVAVNKRQAEIARYFNDKYHHNLRHHHIGEPATDVFYHKIVQAEQASPFCQYSNYLSDMALKYPYLKFHVYFLVDDTVESAFHSCANSRFLQKLHKKGLEKVSQNEHAENSYRRNVANFMLIYTNVNITTMPLSKYLETTPIKYRWRSLPLRAIPFYCGAYAVWKHGGIAMDLDTFDQDFKLKIIPDSRIKTIFDHHNDGIGVKTSDLEVEKPNDDGSLFIIIDKWSRSIKDFMDSVEAKAKMTASVERSNDEDILVRKHRSKRDASNELLSSENERKVDILDSLLISKPTKPTEELNAVETKVPINNLENNTDATPNDVEIEVSTITLDLVKPEDIKVAKIPEDKKKIVDPGNMMIFDFTIFSDLNGPFPAFADPFGIKKDAKHQGVRWVEGGDSEQQKRKNIQGKKLLILDNEGRFFSTNMRYHPFLSQILFPINVRYAEPHNAIENVMATRCLGLFPASYCDYIYFL